MKKILLLSLALGSVLFAKNITSIYPDYVKKLQKSNGTLYDVKSIYTEKVQKTIDGYAKRKGEDTFVSNLSEQYKCLVVLGTNGKRVSFNRANIKYNVTNVCNKKSNRSVQEVSLKKEKGSWKIESIAYLKG